MQSKFWQTKSFKELEKEWEQRLKSEGFEDAEERVGREKKLRQYSYKFAHQLDPTVIEAKIRYYEIIEHFTNNEKFNNPAHEKVMRLHASGMSMQKIRFEAKILGREENDINTIWRIINKYRKKWQIRR